MINYIAREKKRGVLRNVKSKEHNRHGSAATVYHAGCIGTWIRDNPGTIAALSQIFDRLFVFYIRAGDERNHLCRIVHGGGKVFFHETGGITINMVSVMRILTSQWKMISGRSPCRDFTLFHRILNRSCVSYTIFKFFKNYCQNKKIQWEKCF